MYSIYLKRGTCVAESEKFSLSGLCMCALLASKGARLWQDVRKYLLTRSKLLAFYHDMLGTQHINTHPKWPSPLSWGWWGGLSE